MKKFISPSVFPSSLPEFIRWRSPALHKVLLGGSLAASRSTTSAAASVRTRFVQNQIPPWSVRVRHDMRGRSGLASGKVDLAGFGSVPAKW